MLPRRVASARVIPDGSLVDDDGGCGGPQQLPPTTSADHSHHPFAVGLPLGYRGTRGPGQESPLGH